MAASLDARYDLRFMVFAKLRMETVETYSNYRKFQSDSHVVPPAESFP